MTMLASGARTITAQLPAIAAQLINPLEFRPFGPVQTIEKGISRRNETAKWNDTDRYRRIAPFAIRRDDKARPASRSAPAGALPFMMSCAVVNPRFVSPLADSIYSMKCMLVASNCFSPSLHTVMIQKKFPVHNRNIPRIEKIIRNEDRFIVQPITDSSFS
ncbi:hypothetical protein [Burkholderia aenigmatica]|uniref:hypothetical protein n=1 Tax=Burkholderia aenigmatica TaxID=2015348 RepID=UPI001581416C|nr:hypothetical protein [Burkholderia aenigmatica]